MEAEPVPIVDRALPRRVVGVAASAGGVEAIRLLVTGLPADFPGAVCVTLHIPATGRSLLAPILDRDGALHAVVASDGLPLRAGVIYRCRVGHSYSEEAMIDAQGAAVEAALWTALEALEERGELLLRIADRMAGGTPKTEQRFRDGAREALERVTLIRRALLPGAAGHGLTRHDEGEAAEG